MAPMKAPVVNLPHSGPVLTGKLVRRYKRFFVDVVLDGDGDEAITTAHTPNTGSMMGLSNPGQRTLLTHNPAPHRKLHHTLQAVRVGRSWVGCNTGVPNKLMEKAFSLGAVAGFSEYQSVRREVKVGPQGRSRMDLLLHDHGRGKPDCYVEIKNVTLRQNDRARFPDAVTERGRKHLFELMALKKNGFRCAMVFVVQRVDCDAFEPADDIDAAYGETLRKARAAGVEILAMTAHVTRQGIRLKGRIPVRL
jgi:sugar fermentation stimulation protein A